MRNRLLAACAPLLLTTLALAQTPPAATQRMDSASSVNASLCLLDSLLARLDGKPAPAPAGPLCQFPFTIDTVLQYATKDRIILEDPRLIPFSHNYHLFRAMSANSAAECGPQQVFLKRLLAVQKQQPGDGSPWEDSCVSDYNQLRMVKSVITRDPNGAKLCEELLQDRSFSAQVKSGEVADCHKYLGVPGDLKTIAAQTCAGRPKSGQCQNYFRAMSGDATACTKDMKRARLLCNGYAAFARAWKAKSPEACSGDAYCLALMGQAPLATQRALNDLATVVSPALLKEASAKLASVDALIDPTDLSMASAIDIRAERIANLSLRNSRMQAAMSAAKSAAPQRDR